MRAPMLRHFGSGTWKCAARRALLQINQEIADS